MRIGTGGCRSPCDCVRRLRPFMQQGIGTAAPVRSSGFAACGARLRSRPRRGFLRTAVFCKCTFKKILVDTFSPIWYNILSITPVISENLRILVYDFTIFVRLHNFFPVVLCMSHKGRGFSITPCNFCKSVNHWQGINKVQSCMAIPFRIEIP